MQARKAMGKGKWVSSNNRQTLKTENLLIAALYAKERYASSRIRLQHKEIVGRPNVRRQPSPRIRRTEGDGAFRRVDLPRHGFSLQI